MSRMSKSKQVQNLAHESSRSSCTCRILTFTFQQNMTVKGDSYSAVIHNFVYSVNTQDSNAQAWAACVNDRQDQSSYRSLETGMKWREVRMIAGQRQHSLFRQRALDVVVLDNDFLLEDLDSIDFVRALLLRQHDLRAKKKNTWHPWKLSQ